MGIPRRDKEANTYEELQQNTLDLLQQLCGENWTDFNAHDPGITLADSFNYALYELHYRLSFPLESYLADNRGAVFSPGRIGLPEFNEETAPLPVTTADYEQLFVSGLEGVEKCEVCLTDNRLYKVVLYARAGIEKTVLTGKAFRLYHSHRNLCEMVEEIGVELWDGRNRDVPVQDSWIEFRDVKESEISYPGCSKHTVSITHYLPECYGMKETIRSVDPGNAPLLQLKGYITLVDHLIGMTLQQVAQTGELVNLTGGTGHVTLPETETVSGELLSSETPMEMYREKTGHYRLRQRALYMDKLDALYGENTKRWIRTGDLTTKNRKRAELIRQLPDLYRIRFRSYNLSDPAGNLPGVLHFLLAVTGSPADRILPVNDYLSRYQLRLLDDTLFFKKYRYRIQVHITQSSFFTNLEAVPVRPGRFKENRYDALYKQLNMLWHNVLYESFLIYGHDLSNYRMIHRWGEGYVLLFRVPHQDIWLTMGLFHEKEHLIDIANRFCRFINHIVCNNHPIYLVEDILLEKGESSRPDRLYVVIPRWLKAKYTKDFIEKEWGERFPAHLDIHFRWLKQGDMEVFERLWYPWREAWSQGHTEEKRRLSRQISRFLETFGTERRKKWR